MANRIDQVIEGVVGVLRAIKRKTRAKKVGYVAGIITSDGPEYIARNIQKLEEYTERIGDEIDFPVFSAADVFSKDLLDRLHARSLPAQTWFDFWRAILGSGEVTDIFMTPRWKDSLGARDEHETAQKLGIAIHYLFGMR